jgi:putative sterol carrier protein
VIEETLASLMDRFNRHAEANPSVGQELKGVERTIALKLSDGEQFSLQLKDGRLGNLRKTLPAKADVTIRTDSATFLALVRREVGPMKALVTGKLAIDGSLDDKLLFRKLL